MIRYGLYSFILKTKSIGLLDDYPVDTEVKKKFIYIYIF